MSYSIDYFFNSDKSFQQLCEEMEEFLDFTFEVSEEYENQVYAKFLGIGLDFYTHDYENDGELNFSGYKYYIGSTGRSYSKDLRLPFMALIAEMLYLQMGISEAILIFNLQRILAKYKEKVDPEGYKDLYDEVSNTFVEFPQHLINLDKLAWQ